MDKNRAPLYERLVEHRSRHTASFHVPGHKYGACIAEDAGELEPLMRFDFTELTGLDDLHQPEGVIREAEQLAAQCYAADRTFFLVQGSTLGNMTMILSVCEPGDVILVDRFVHKSVINGLMLAGARAVFLTPVWDTVTGYPAGIDVRSLQTALDKYPEAKAVFLTRPNYFGHACELADIAATAHRFGVPLLVDEAHGAHFGFHEEVPKSALSFGADAVVQSTHKMLSALTMGAMLHVQGSRIAIERIAHNLRMLQTSSPSYPIMASLDVARRMVHSRGPEWIGQGLEAIRYFERGMEEMPWFQLVSASDNRRVRDPFKQPVLDLSGTLDGYRLQACLEAHGCMIEMADPRHVLLVFSPYSSLADSERILKIFRLISTQYHLDKKELSDTFANIYRLPTLPLSNEPLTFSRHMINDHNMQWVPLAQAVGKYSADMIIPYPPGIPFVYPGERLHGDVVEALQEMASKGARFQGSADSNLNQVRITRPRV